jgi:hypothetical protein
MLLDAQIFARDVRRSAWDFAMEVDVLNAQGLNYADLRWLICRGFVETAVEVRSDPNRPGRSFQREGELQFTRYSCCVLSDAGVHFVQQMAAEGCRVMELPPEITSARQSAATDVGLTPRPIWDRDRQELRIGSSIVKQFKVPAPNQEVVLAAFHEEGWPVRIDDPLPPRDDIQPKRRLHDTIVSLNRNQKTKLLQFSGDGSGEGVRWEVCAIRQSRAGSWQT